jgi:outer membrane biosynthesis protein TonB
LPSSNPPAPADSAVPALSGIPSAGQSNLAAAYGAPPAPPGVAVSAPPAVVEVGTPEVEGGALPNLDTVVSALRNSFEACVTRGRATRPDLQGTATVTIRVGGAGQVLGVAVQQSTKIPAPVASCLSTRAATAQFDPPKGAKGQVTVRVPVNVPKP